MARNQRSSGNVLNNQLRAACYARIQPYLECYQAETDCDRSLQMMAPENYQRFAVQARQDVANVVVAFMTRAYTEATRSGSGTLQELRPNRAVTTKILDGLAPCIVPFLQALEQYAGWHVRTVHMLAETRHSLFENSFELGGTIAQLAGGVLGPLGTLILTSGVGYVSGKRLEKRFEQEGEQLNQVFAQMLRCYDEAMGELHRTALEMLEWYCDQLVDASH